MLQNKPATISILIPGATNLIVYSFVKNTLNEYNSSSLNFNCNECGDFVDLPDGFYEATLKSNPPYELTKHYLKTDATQLEIDKMVIEAASDAKPSQEARIKEIMKIKFFLYAAEAHTRRGDLNEAQRYFQYVLSKIDCKTCH